MGCPCGGRVFFTAASLIQTAAAICIGISFFGPYWLNNVNQANDASEVYITSSDVVGPSIVYYRPYRGLWAQCGTVCTWFWQNNYQLQNKKFTPLKWHLATQVLYFIAAALILTCEIFARVQMCCKERTRIYVALGVMALVSALFQLASVATFGGGAVREPYNAVSDPIAIGQQLLNDISGTSSSTFVYLGWCYWLAVVGNIITVIAGVFFLLAACCRRGSCFCCDEK